MLEISAVELTTMMVMGRTESQLPSGFSIVGDGGVDFSEDVDEEVELTVDSNASVA